MGQEPINMSENAMTRASTLELDRYLPAVETEFESEEAAAEFLRTLWNIMCAFVDLGWGVDSIQLVFAELAAPDDQSRSEDA